MQSLSVTGMTCQNCVKHVTSALSAVPGVTRVSVDLATGIARVEGDASLPSLLDAVREEGYDAAVV
ncbi:MAG TPA: heavy metal-associated domain-containing protein [Pantanalinema sp.]